jgi:ankyrin repeat protein
MVLCKTGSVFMKKTIVSIILIFTTFFAVYANQDLNLLRAAKNGDVIFVDKALKKGANVNIQNIDRYTPLMIASMQGHVKVVKFLLKAGANANIRIWFGNTALSFASLGNHYKIVKILLKHIKNTREGKDIINHAFSEVSNTNNIGIAKLLLKAGANINMISENSISIGKPPLVASVQSNKYNMVKFLLSKGANVNLIDFEFNWSALMYASLHGHIEIAKLLIKAGAAVNLKNKYGRTALSIALDAKHKEIAKLLKAHGAR